MKRVSFLYALFGFFAFIMFSCQGNRCAQPATDIHFEAELRQAYTQQKIIGRILSVFAKDNLFVCDDLPIKQTFFSNFDGFSKGNFLVKSNQCDDLCSPFNYFLAAQPDSLVCVNNYQALENADNKLTFLFKPYVILQLHLVSGFDGVEVMTVEIAPEAENLHRTVSIFHNKSFYFGLRSVDTTIFARVLPEEPVTLKMVGRTTTFYFRRSFVFTPEYAPVVHKTINF